MTMYKLYAALGALCLATSAAHASIEQNAHVTTYTAQEKGQMFFNTDGQRSATPGCSTIPGRWVIDATTPAGQMMVAAMLTALAEHKTIFLVGTGDCGVWGDTETVDYFVAS